MKRGKSYRRSSRVSGCVTSFLFLQGMLPVGIRRFSQVKIELFKYRMNGAWSHDRFIEQVTVLYNLKLNVGRHPFTIGRSPYTPVGTD
jgi:hypothetical protein